MKKRKILTALLSLTIAASALFGCGGAKTSGFELGAFKNDQADGSFDSKYFYRNDLHVFGGDADIEWVPADRDSVYGGWFYMYTSGNDGVPVQLEPDNTRSAVTVLRSRDLNDWELCGAVADGFSCEIDENEWIIQHVWAPEVIYNPADGKYYMYYNAFGPWGTDAEPWLNKETDQWFDRFYGAVLMSDTPVGPFKLATSERYYGDAAQANPNGDVITGRTPQINVTAHFGLDEVFSVIDFSPFYDENGDLYLYFVRHMSTGHEHNCLWGVKMKDMITPDYDTLTMLAQCSYETVEKKSVDTPVWDEGGYECKGYFGSDEGVERDPSKGNEWDDEWTVNEGPQMYKTNGRYFLTYSPRGFSDPNYDVKQAIGDSPLGPFRKLPQYPATVMGKNDTNDYATGTGHHAFVEVEGELFCAFYVHADPYSGKTSDTDGRIYAFDRVKTIEDPTYGTLLYGNGPTKSVQPKPYVASGYKNVAGKATVSATDADKGTLKYVNDDIFVTHAYFEDREFSAKGKTTITLKFAEPQTVGAVMVYNSFNYDYAFSKIDAITFRLAEKPAWFNLGNYTDSCYIENIPFNTDYYDGVNKFMRQGGAAIASFDDIKVTEISITISEKIEGEGEIRVSDVVVLGK